MIFLYGVILGALYLFQDVLIFRPVELDKEVRYQFDYPFEEHDLFHPNGETINSLHFEKGGPSKGVVLYFHGNAGNLKSWGRVAKDFLDRDYDVFMIDYRGYGKSDGEASERNLYEDGILAYEWVADRYHPDRIVLYGRSLGSSVASHVSKEKSCNTLILESPLASVKDVIDFKYPYLLTPLDPDHNFSNFESLEGLNCNVHIIHGTEDEVIPLESMTKLKEHLAEDDSFYIVEGGGHNNLSSFPAFYQEIDRLLK